jgi:tetratricopeptide (TPR) repeat protein
MTSVEKDLFIKVLNRYSDSSVEEAKEVLSLKESFPYSQLLHALSARLAKDHGFSSHQSELQIAAVYAADRGVLKEVMTEETIQLQYPEKTTFVSDADNTVVVSPSFTVAARTTGESNLVEEVMHDLERLHQLRHNFEMLFDDHQPAAHSNVVEAVEKEEGPEVEEVQKDTTKSKKERIKELAKATQAKSEPEETKSKKERIIELAKASQEKGDDTPETEPEPKTKGRKKKSENSGEELIEEIANKEELSPEGDKQKEQLEIIEQFIKIQPSITQTKEKPFTPPTGDLSTIKTGEFGDNIVSETLVEILVKQGKKDKAIEVLKKLIWKFPQKKAYFAAQIEDLRK